VTVVGGRGQGELGGAREHSGRTVGKGLVLWPSCVYHPHVAKTSVEAIKEGLHHKRCNPSNLSSLQRYYSGLRLRIQPTSAAPRLPNRRAPGAGIWVNARLSMSAPATSAIELK
jgi:hypothetical protein